MIIYNVKLFVYIGWQEIDKDVTQKHYIDHRVDYDHADRECLREG